MCLKELLNRYIDVFAQDETDVGFTDKVRHEINITEITPTKQPYRRFPGCSKRSAKSPPGTYRQTDNKRKLMSTHGTKWFW